MTATPSLRRPWAMPAVIFAATLAAYVPVLRAGFIWDDDGHVTRPDLESLRGLGRIWFELGATQQYYPVLHSAFWAEHCLLGNGPHGYHLLNVLLHALAATLFGCCLRVLLRPVAGASPLAVGVANFVPWSAALLFALHPVEVESVAWISEQKNTLSAVLYFAALLVYLRFEGTRRWSLYAVATGLFVLAVLTKSVTVTLPAVIAVALWWRRGRLEVKRDVVPLLPWLLVGVGAGLITAWVERDYIGARGVLFSMGPAARLALAGRIFWFYAGKVGAAWPLIFIYPRWAIDPSEPAQWLGTAAALVLIVGGVVLARRRRTPLAVLLCFGGTLVPALGFVDVYPFVFSYVADHFQYLASAWLLAGLAGAAGVLWVRSPAGLRPLLATIGLLILVGLGGLTALQASTYRDAETLYRATLARNQDAWLAHDNLGVILSGQGKLDEAIDHFKKARLINPAYAETDNNLGNAYGRAGRLRDAIETYAEAVRIQPKFVTAQVNWGNALSDAGRYDEANTHYEAALAINPVDPDVEYRLASGLANAGHVEAALPHFGRALALRPGFTQAEANLGLGLVTLHRSAEALPHLQQAVALDPRYAEGHAYLGFALADSGDAAGAAVQYRLALAINPADANVHYQLALALRALGQYREAQIEYDAARRYSSGHRP